MKLSNLIAEKKVGRGIDPTTARPVTSTNQAWIPKFSRKGKGGDIFLATSVIKMGARKKWVGAIFNLDMDPKVKNNPAILLDLNTFKASFLSMVFAFLIWYVKWINIKNRPIYQPKCIFKIIPAIRKFKIEIM